MKTSQWQDRWVFVIWTSYISYTILFNLETPLQIVSAIYSLCTVWSLIRNPLVIDALVVSMELINQAIRSVAVGMIEWSRHMLCSEAAKVGEKRIYLFTDAGSDFNDNQLDQICEGVRNLDIHLTIV